MYLTLQDVNVIQLKSLQASFDGVKDVLGILQQTCVYGEAEHYLATQTMLIDKSIFVRGQACPYEGECGHGEVYLKRS